MKEREREKEDSRKGDSAVDVQSIGSLAYLVTSTRLCTDKRQLSESQCRWSQL